MPARFISPSAVLLLAFGLASCGDEGGGDGGLDPEVSATPRPSPSPSATPAVARPGVPEDAPVLRNLGVDFAPYDPLTGLAGAFDFHVEIGWTQKVFLEFGGRLFDRGLPQEGRPLYVLTYALAEGAPIYAPIEGVVSERIFQSDSQDFELWLLPDLESGWLVVVDHLVDPEVEMGDVVAAGDVLGRSPGGLLDLNVNHFMSDTSWCPLLLFEPDAGAAAQADVARLMADWERVLQVDPYDEAAMVVPGCLVDRDPRE